MAFEDGLKKVEESSCFKGIIPCKRLSEEYKAFSPNSQIFPNQETRERLKEMCEKYGRQLYPEHPLGYDNSQALIVLPHNTPNNTLPVIWAGDKNEKEPGVIWHSLWKRRKKVQPYIGENKPEDRNELPPICRLPDRCWMPYRFLGDKFVGRVSDLWEVHDILCERKTAVVEGIGIVVGAAGIGKTQLAIEYVHRFGRYYSGGVFWIDAEHGIYSIITQVLKGASLDIDNTLEERDQLCQLWSTFRQFQPVLIVLDNFPENEPLQTWLPPASSIHTLVTTRRRDLNYSRLPLEFMTSEEGIKLLNSGQRKFGQEAENLVEALGGLPLALELARNFLNIRADLTIDSLLKEIKNAGEIRTLSIFAEKYANELPTGHIKEVAATFQISYNQVSKTAKDVLQCMSLLSPKPTPRELLRKILDISPKNALEDPLDEAISELASKFSLVELDKENDPWMHRLIASFVKSTIDENNGWQDKVVRAVTDEMARVIDDKDTLSYYQLEKIIPHAEISLSSESMGTEQAIKILGYLCWHNSKWGRYRIAEKYGREALDLAERYYEPGHPSIATSQSNLALVLQDLGELEEARDLLRQAYNTFLNKFGPQHPHTKIVKKTGKLCKKK